ncbi:MAG: hypothetical protein COC02_05080 [Rhodospirillaceae bacterium]|jgi:hypothetical protein|nr:MAG: hypothetical protein COC02_05040 [Rhodospirillaceae bacterium]PCH82820.1 MAG: hypothetical protein COC02_05080 [Rhodospirillaceae bacterium]
MDLLCRIKALFLARPGCKFIGCSDAGIARWKCDNNNNTSQEIATKINSNGTPFSTFDGAILQNNNRQSQGMKNENIEFNSNMVTYLLIIGSGVFLFNLMKN